MARVSVIPEGSVLVAVAGQNFTWLTAVCEWIDNALDAEATYIEVAFGKLDKETFVSVQDNGLGCADLTVFAKLGKHVQHRARGLGRFGIGSKDAALWSGGEGSELRVTSVHKATSQHSTLGISWRELAQDWTIDEPIKRSVKPTDAPGTRLVVIPVIRKVPEGADWEKLLRDIGYRYSPAIKRGVQITMRSKKKGASPEALQGWAFPKLQPGHVDTVIDVGGKKARVYCGLVREGEPNQRRGLSYLYRFRVIKEACGKGCGGHNFSRVAGFVEIDDSWPLTKNKDDIQSAEALYAAVEGACKPILLRADEQASQLVSKSFLREVEGLLNASHKDSKGRRKKTNEKSGTKEPTGRGGKHTQAENEKPGSTFTSKRRRGIRLAYDDMERPDDPGEFVDGTVTLNTRNPMVSAARDKNALATAAIAASVIAIRECYAQKNDQQVRILECDACDVPERFRRTMGHLMNVGLELDGQSVIDSEPTAAE